MADSRLEFTESDLNCCSSCYVDDLTLLATI